MVVDPLSIFLQTDAWASHSGGTRDETGNIFVKQSLPAGGSYWIASRCHIPENWSLPSFAQKSWFLRMQADSQESYDNILKNTTSYKHRQGIAVQPQQTIVIDLKKSDEELLADMKQKHRYNIKVAEKNNVMTEFHHDNLMTVFPRFWALLNTTAERHDFHTHTESHYRSIITNLGSTKNVMLAFATHEGKDVAAFMIINQDGVGTYLHGGSNYDERNLMAPYLLHWKTMQELRKYDVTLYDLWGVHVQNGKEIANHPSAGTTRFKLGFGGTLVEYPPSIDIILNPFCYTVYTSIQRFRSRKRAFA